jgi:hypothetical protein
VLARERYDESWVPCTGLEPETTGESASGQLNAV